MVDFEPRCAGRKQAGMQVCRQAGRQKSGEQVVQVVEPRSCTGSGK